MRERTLLTIASIAALYGAAGPWPGPTSETPRATDLFKAEERAREVQERLEIPPDRGRSGWLHGGSGWNGRSTERNEERPPHRGRRSEDEEM